MFLCHSRRGRRASYFPSQNVKVRSLFPLVPGLTLPSELAGSTCAAVRAGRGSLGFIVKVESSENTKGQKKASVLFKHLCVAGEPQDLETETDHHHGCGSQLVWRNRSVFST